MTSYRSDDSGLENQYMWTDSSALGYNLTPSIMQQEGLMQQDMADFDAMFVNEQTPPLLDRPGYKRALSSGSITLRAIPDSKRGRMTLPHTDSNTSTGSNQTASTATSNHDSGDSNRASPCDSPGAEVNTPSDYMPQQHQQPQQAMPSVLMPAAAGPEFEHMMRTYAQMAHARQPAPVGLQQSHSSQGIVMPSMQQQQQQFQAEPLSHHVTRKSKAAAMQHLEEVVDDEQEEEDELLERGMGSKGMGKRQGRKKSIAVKVKEEEEKLMEGDEDKRAQFLERNRLAACKSRQKKKEWIKSLETQSEDLTRQNGDLQVLVTALRDEIGSLRTALAAHAQCACRANHSILSSHNQAAQAQQHSVGAEQQPQQQQQPMTMHTPVNYAPSNAQWAAMSPTRAAKDLPRSAPASTMPPRTPGVIDFAYQQADVASLVAPAVADADYFGPQFYGGARPALNTPELAKSLGYGA